LLDLLLLLFNFAQLGLLLSVMELLLHPDPGLLPDGGYRAVFHGMAIVKTFLLVPFIARLPVERLPVKAAPDSPFLRAPVVRGRA
jgi:hypothetical protein